MLNRPRIPLPRLVEALETDTEFVAQALNELAFIDRVSTYTAASAASGLINHWLVERDLTCYSRGEIVEDVAALSVCEINGSFDISMTALEDGLLIDRNEFLELLKALGFKVPAAFSASEHAAISTSSKAPLQRQRLQEQEIIRALNELGHNPLAIPKWKAGERGVKSAIREVLKSHKWSKKVFDKAWQRLRDSREIAEV